MDRNSSDIFCLKGDPDTNNTNKIFSVKGSPSFRINRKPEYSTVFPITEANRANVGKRTGAIRPSSNAGPDQRAPAGLADPYPHLSPGREAAAYQEASPRIAPSEEYAVGNEQFEDMDVDGMEMPQMRQVAQPSSPKFKVPHSVNLSSMPRNILTGEGLDSEVVRNQGAARKTQQWTW